MAEFGSFSVGKTDYIKDQKLDLDNARKGKAERIEEIARASEELTARSADLG